jgi:predicted membrane channel-forming protein YqfA (hemolysin III family)
MLGVTPYASLLSIYASTDHSQKVDKAICFLFLAALCVCYSLHFAYKSYSFRVHPLCDICTLHLQCVINN